MELAVLITGVVFVLLVALFTVKTVRIVPQALARNVVFGLPGAAESFTLADVQAHLAEYRGISAERLRGHLVDFLSEVAPVAERLGLRLCCHPAAPPFALLGLPRIMSTEADYAAVMDAVDSPASGITLCTGSLGARPDNDLPGMMQHFSAPTHELTEDLFTEGIGFDGSSIRGFQQIQESDMVLLPDPDTAVTASIRVSSSVHSTVPVARSSP